MVGSKKLAWQQGAFAQHAEIELVVEPREVEGISVIILEDVSPHWSNAIRFGVTLFAEHFAHGSPAVAQMGVRVESLKTMPCDTTPIALAYVTFQALCSAWGMDGEEVFVFNRPTGSYLFDPLTPRST